MEIRKIRLKKLKLNFDLYFFFQKSSKLNFDLCFFQKSSKLNFDLYFFQKSSKLNFELCQREVSTCTYMTTSGMHRRPFEGWHLVIHVAKWLHRYMKWSLPETKFKTARTCWQWWQTSMTASWDCACWTSSWRRTTVREPPAPNVPWRRCSMFLEQSTGCRGSMWTWLQECAPALLPTEGLSVSTWWRLLNSAQSNCRKCLTAALLTNVVSPKLCMVSSLRITYLFSWT